MKAICKHCNHKETIGTRLGGKLGLGLAGALLGTAAVKKHPFVTLLCIGGGALLGHAIDTSVLPNCPSCKVALQVANAAF
ncbi:hypothetical protein [Corallococcus exiguus]|uniref:hypothetical protein n=1 Tax=Corallococcus exiguus TaxID=83462 RepID=UPI0015606458|nr:hypothetical protein [Corallococcus exiguus]NRD45957.1 hypothetical protein [Corallococcus exiguus]